jgi:pilus assembly protein Flp/PilA
MGDFGMRTRLAMSRWWRDTGGATAIEYALLASIVSICIVGGLILTRTNLISLFQSVSSGFALR